MHIRKKIRLQGYLEIQGFVFYAFLLSLVIYLNFMPSKVLGGIVFLFDLINHNNEFFGLLNHLGLRCICDHGATLE